MSEIRNTAIKLKKETVGKISTIILREEEKKKEILQREIKIEAEKVKPEGESLRRGVSE